jgi:light-regulated signal transduction histidine kinase (bacteriophytochrome)
VPQVDATVRWLSLNAEPVHAASGEVRGVVVSFFNITAAKHARERILQLNAELEQRVLERTAELEFANKELVAFSYSVAHDLRAPLRSVNSFSQLILENFGEKLPEEGRLYLQKIHSGATRMGTLIDDLLNFSQLSHQALNKQAIDTDLLVHTTLDELGSPWKNRCIDLRIARLQPCQGDEALVKQVWTNLLSNALKYTSKRDRAEIDIGCQDDQGEQVFSVRDNGAGFDMADAGKLFGTFQRLHSAKEFEGHGIGLATVQRIVHRHGGRIWAEAAVDHGASFYFTLNGTTNTGGKRPQ